ncbi:MAG: acetoin utilization protein [Cereibacter sphaeroides]|uniref:Acetoin utilization protein n=1 Tax=Cereibacter sphaeroides TaxID=1063 RepID=A0A2W5RXX0_CERSP|nr:MAG: acetoin utilization protein [Cereibacter sphaeroides]
MTTAYFSDEAFGRHVTPPGHSEQVARFAAIKRGLAGLDLDRREAPVGEDADILRCHPASFLARIRKAAPDEGVVQLDPDTFMSPGTMEAALRAVGGVCAAVDLVIEGGASNAYVGCRPPGHHAEPEITMGFCIFGNVAIGAMRALEHHGLSRVAIVDFDVHHGNGTQALLWDEPRVLTITSQQMPLWPGTGDPSEKGAHGQVVNVPLPPGSGGPEMRAAYEAKVFPRIEAFRPELILISAGFDAHADDPLAELNWREADYAWLTGRICDLADAHAGGRVVSVQEGGYDLGALERSVAAHVGVLQERGR